MASLLDRQPDFNVIGEAGTAQDAVKKAMDLQPDLILMDVGLPDYSGVDAAKKILAQRPETRIVMITIHEGDQQLFSAIKSGAKGYILKNTPISDLLASLRALERGEAAISRTLASKVIEEYQREAGSAKGRALDSLTPREIDVLKELSTNATNFEIAERLVITENTVKVHVHNILKKLDMQNRREASRYARRHGLGQSSGTTEK